ncbi:MAG: tetratricopeptide repeat protein [gamma proteobacterium symbiont of Lucinoma myriamae]|nr:tetratricopeptide repeat protein [gamma proteobacterium symbiont of Lucinoma myriamae]MCU7833266.1 tetratricopeptide repeat protein [gamma proteobacterium symbiont of Lucinoma myriamae]
MQKIILIILISLIGIYGCSSPEEKAEEYYQKAQTLFEQGEFSKAALELKNTIKINSQHADAHYMMGLINEKNKNWKVMHANLLNAIKFNPKHADATVSLAKLRLMSGELELSKETLNKALSIAPENINAQMLQAAFAYREKNKDKAIELISNVLKENPNNIDVLQLYVSMALKEKKYKNIQQAIEQVTRDDKNEKKLDLLIIQLNAAQGKEAEVVKLFNHLIFEEPDNLSYRQTLALYFLRRNKQEQAIQVLRDTVQDNPDSTTAKLTLISFLSRHDMNEAISELEKQIKTSTNEDNELKLALAELYQRQGKKEDALSIYHSILEHTDKESEKLRIKNNLINIALSSKKMEEARRLIQEVLEQDTNNTDALLNRTLIKLSEKDYASAITDLRIILRDKPRDEKSLELLAAAYALNNTEELATDTIVQILQINPLNRKAANQYALINLKVKKYSKVIEILRPLEKNQKLDKRGLAMLMNAYLASEKWEDAKKLTGVIESKDSSAYKTYINAIILQGEGKYDESSRSLLSMLEADSSGTLPLNALVSNYLKQKDQNGAIKYLNNFIEKNPSKNAQAYILLTKLYLANKEPEKAIETYKKLILQQPENLSNYRTLAEIYISQKQVENAVATYQEALKQKPDALFFRLSLAMTYEKLKQNKKAIQQYEIVLKQKPDTDIAANNLASLLIGSGSSDELERAYQVAKRFEGTKKPFYADTLGWIYYLKGDMNNALIMMKVAVESKEIPVNYYHLGKVYIGLNEYENAKAQFVRAIELADKKGKFEGYDDAKITLDSL